MSSIKQSFAFALVVLFLLGCTPAKEMVIADQDRKLLTGNRAFAVVSVAGDQLNRYRTGFTSFATERERLETKSQGIDQLLEELLIREMRNAGLQVKSAAAARDVLRGTNALITFGGEGVPLPGRQRWTDYRETFRKASSDARVDVLVLLRATHFGDSVGGLGNFPPGLGVTRQGVANATSLLYAMLDINLIDVSNGAVFAKIELRKDDGSRNGVTPTVRVDDRLGTTPVSSYSAQDIELIKTRLVELLEQPMKNAVSSMVKR